MATLFGTKSFTGDPLRMLPAARWYLGTVDYRRRNPRSVLDVGRDPVPYSEIRDTFPDLFSVARSLGNAVDDRVDFDLALTQARAELKATKKTARAELLRSWRTRTSTWEI